MDRSIFYKCIKLWVLVCIIGWGAFFPFNEQSFIQHFHNDLIRRESARQYRGQTRYYWLSRSVYNSVLEYQHGGIWLYPFQFYYCCGIEVDRTFRICCFREFGYTFLVDKRNEHILSKLKIFFKFWNNLALSSQPEYYKCLIQSIYNRENKLREGFYYKAPCCRQSEWKS